MAQTIDTNTYIQGCHDKTLMASLILEVRDPAKGLHIELLHVSPFHNNCEVRIIAPSTEAFHAAAEKLAAPFYD